MPDGSIRVSTKLDLKPAEADLKKLEKECEKTAEKIKNFGQTAQAVFTGMSKGQLNSAFKTANKELEKTEAALAEVEDKIKEIQSETDKMLPEAATDDQAAALLSMEEHETAPLLAQRDALTAAAEEYRAQLEAITAELYEQTRAEEAQKALQTDGKTAAGDAEWLSKIQTQEQYNAALDTTKSKMAAIEQEASRISQETGVAKEKLLQQDKEYQKLSRRLKLLTSDTRKFGEEGANAGKKTSKEMSKTTKAAKSFGNTLKDGIKKAGKMALAVIGIRAAYNAVRRAADSYMESVPELKEQLTSLWNIAGQAIGPFINALVKGISTVVVWVNALIKALTGVDLVAKANAAALKKQASATTAASKAAAQLAGFDEINKLNDNASAGGGGAGIFDASMAGDIPDFMEEVKKKLLAGDFFGAGETLGDAIIKWVEDTDWNSVGQKIGEIIGGVIGFALGLAVKINPFTIHNSVTSLIGGLFSGLAKEIQKWDWAEIGSALVDALLFALLALDPVALIVYTLLQPEGAELAKGVSEFVGSLIGGIAKAILGAGKRIGEIAKNLWTSIKSYFDEYVDWEGTPGEIISGLWEGIKDAFKNVGEWIKNNIWVPFRDGFKKAFGIASPAKEMKPLGEDIINGVKEGIGNIWNKVKEKFDNFKGKIDEYKTAIKTKAKNVGTSFKEGLEEGLQNIANKIKSPINSVIAMIEKACNYIVDKINKLSFKVPNWVPGIGGNTFGFNLKKISIPRLAQGGIVNNPGRGVPVIAGEAGKEAILPLDRNTEWMDILADKINAGVQKIVVPIYLNGKKIAEEIIDLNNKRTFATNGAI